MILILASAFVFVSLFSLVAYHLEHGWWYPAGTSTEAIWLYDTALSLWGWTNEAYYSWILWYTTPNTWSYSYYAVSYHSNHTPECRHYYQGFRLVRNIASNQETGK